MSEYAIRPLDASTWDAFARLAEKHKGMGFGGCWCTWFHSRVGRPEGEKGRPWKERLVREGDAHAALVFDGDAAVAWCQYGSPDELPNIHHRKEYEATRTDEPPDYRITCIFVDRDYRRKGVAGVALRGAELIEPLDDESDYVRFLSEKGEGVHHIAVAPTNYDQALRPSEEGERGSSQRHVQRHQGRVSPDRTRSRDDPRDL
jgi:GNAT superfamily N-acetyltransferase